MKQHKVEEQLEALAAEVRWPPTPDVASGLAVAISDESHVPGPSRPRRRGARAALAGTAILALTAVAVPSVRATLERVLGVEARERIERVQEVPVGSPLDFGRSVTRAGAQAITGRPIREPRRVGPLLDIRVDGDLPRGAVALIYARETVLTQMPSGTVFAIKALGASVPVTPIRVGDATGYWIAQGPRALVLLDATGTARRVRSAVPGAGVLLWDRGGTAFRLETRRPRAAAVAIGRSVR